MLKTLNELNIKTIDGSSPSAREINALIYQFQTTPITKAKALELVEDIHNSLSSSVVVSDIVDKLTSYARDFEWSMGDKDVIQRMLNYCVAYWIKTKNDDGDDKILQHLRRWKYVKSVAENSPFKTKLNTKYFSKLNKELLKVLEDRYK